jgi:tetratricopeptide (TPR) repeat protein
MGPDVSYSLLKEPDDNYCRTLRSPWEIQRFYPLKLKRLERVLRLSVALLLVGCVLFESIAVAEARSRRTSTGRSRHSAGGSFRSGRFMSKGKSKGSSRSAPSRSSGRKGGKSSKHSKGHAVSAPAHHGPTAAQIKRQETSGANDLEKRTELERSYRAYDQGLTEWLAGNYAQAAKYLNESYELYSDFHGSHDVLDSIYLYDLGQAAEAAGDISLAKNSYQRSLRRRPDFSDCCIRLTALLTKNGETALALVYARRLVDKNPQDPRAQFLLATMLEKAGFAAEGKTVRENFNVLMKGGTLAAPKNQVEQGITDSVLNKDSDTSAESKKSEPGEKAEKDEFDAESAGTKTPNSNGIESGTGGGALRKPDSEVESK